MISAEQMRKDLAQFYGSMGYTKFMSGMVLTDGTKYLAEVKPFIKIEEFNLDKMILAFRKSFLAEKIPNLWMLGNSFSMEPIPEVFISEGFCLIGQRINFEKFLTDTEYWKDHAGVGEWSDRDFDEVCDMPVDINDLFENELFSGIVDSGDHWNFHCFLAVSQFPAEIVEYKLADRLWKEAGNEVRWEKKR